jgi:elongator complex protein 3
MIPPYCRVDRVIRDIPSDHVVEGNRRTSLRQDAFLEMERRGTRCQCIRCREIRGKYVSDSELEWSDLVYEPARISGEPASTEHFISYVTGNDQIAGYMRLSFPQQIPAERDTEMPDLIDSAIIREIHVYGQALAVGADRSGSAQHIGLGTKLIEIAAEKAKMAGYKHLSVISAIGTREYYRKRGFTYGSQYQIMDV